MTILKINNNISLPIIIALRFLTFCFLFNSAFGAELEHPGLLSTKTDLDFVKEQIQNKKEPWYSAYTDLKSENPENRTPNFNARIIGLDNHKPMDEMTRDGSNAYACALLWYISGEKKYSRNAIKLLNAWIGFKQHDNNLFLSWAAPQFLNAAEIMMHTPGSGWSKTDSEKFSDMVRKLWLPEMRKGNTPNNSKHSAIEAHMACAIFLDSKTELDKAVGQWKRWTPAYLYVESDGEPISVTRRATWTATPIYHGQSSETCRDLNHTRLGSYSIFFSAEMAWNQKIDLWKLEQERLTAFSELHAGWLSGDVKVPDDICNGAGVFCAGGTKTSSKRGRPPGCGGALWEIPLNHIQNRLGKTLPRTEKLTKNTRPDIRITHRNRKFQTLTHANLYLDVIPTSSNSAPIASFKLPSIKTIEDGYTQLIVEVDASDPNGDKISATLSVDGQVIRTENVAPYEWGHQGSPNPNELLNLEVGEHVLRATVTDTKGQETVIEKTITVDATLSSENFTRANQFSKVKLYPSPTSSILNVSGLSGNENILIEIIDITGKVLLSEKITTENTSIDVSKLAKGIYFSKIKSGSNEKVLRFVKN